MKNLLKIGALSLALIAAVFMLNTHAAETGDLKLEITGQTGYCNYGTYLDLGITGFSYNARTRSGNFLTTTGDNVGAAAWNCTDSNGVATRSLTLQSSDVRNMDTLNSAHTIPATSVKIYSPLATVVSGACTSVTGSNNGSAIDSAKSILEKASALGDSCRVETSFVDLTVDLAASQAIGQYSGTLTVSVPSL